MKKVLRFTASWCQPCKTLAKMLEEIKTDKTIEVYDIDDYPEQALQYSIRGVPTLIMLDNETEVKRMSGFKSKQDLENWLND